MIKSCKFLFHICFAIRLLYVYRENLWKYLTNILRVAVNSKTAINAMNTTKTIWLFHAVNNSVDQTRWIKTLMYFINNCNRLRVAFKLILFANGLHIKITSPWLLVRISTLPLSVGVSRTGLFFRDIIHRRYLKFAFCNEDRVGRTILKGNANYFIVKWRYLLTR